MRMAENPLRHLEPARSSREGRGQLTIIWAVFTVVCRAFLSTVELPAYQAGLTKEQFSKLDAHYKWYCRFPLCFGLIVYYKPC